MNIVLENIVTENTTESTVENTITESVYNSISQNTTAVLDSYVYQDGLNLVYSESENVSYSSITECRQALDNYFAFYFRQLATIPDVSLGINYLINLSKVVNYYVQSSNLVIQLSDKVLTIPCINATHATNHINYLDFAVKNNSFVIASLGKTILYVDADNYTTLTDALAVAVSGNMIVVDKMLSERVLLKDGVDIWFNAGAGNAYALGIYETLFYTDVAITCNIYGYGVFENINLVGGFLFRFEFNSIVNVGYESMTTSPNYACVYSYGANSGGAIMRSKGHTMTGRPLDSDGETYLLDADAVNMTAGADTVLYPDNSLNTYFYLRNALMTNDSDIYGTLYLQSSILALTGERAIYDMSLINVRAENYGSKSVIHSPADEVHTVRLFNSFLKADTKVIETQYAQKTNVISYGDTNILNVENYEDVNLTGTIIVDSTLTLAEV